MTTSLLEPLLAPPAAPLASPPREAPATADRPFRDLLADSPRDAESPSPADFAAPPVAEPVAQEPRKSTDRERARDEADETVVPAAYAVPTPVVSESKVADIEPSAEAIASVATEEASPSPRAPVKKQLRSPPATAADEVSAISDDKIDPTAASGEKATAAAETKPAATADPTAAVAATAPAANGEVVSEATATSDIVASQPAAQQPESPTAVEPERGTAPRESHGKTRDNQPRDSSTASAPDAAPAVVNEVAIGEDNSQRTKSRPRDSAKRDAAASESLQRTGAANEPAAAPPPAGPPVATAPSATSSLTTPDASLPVAAEAAALRGESLHTTATEPFTAATERLGALLGQRRMKLAHGGHGQPLTDSQQARLVQRVARAIDTARLRGDAEIRLRLSPPELGPLKLEVRLESGAMTVRLEVETAAAQQALADNLGALRQRLAEQNIRVEQFDIDLLDRNAGNGSDSGARQSADGERHAPQRSFGRNDEHRHATNTTNETQPSRATTAMGNTSLDVLI